VEPQVLRRDQPHAWGEPSHPVRLAAEVLSGAFVILAHPETETGADAKPGFPLGRWCALGEQPPEAAGEVSALRQAIETTERRAEMLAGHGRRLSMRVDELRARLLEAHTEMIRRDDQLRLEFGGAVDQRNTLLIERETLVAQRDALLEQCRALTASLEAARRRLEFVRRSPLGIAYRAFRRCWPSRPVVRDR
jgi:hypothetical protein